MFQMQISSLDYNTYVGVIGIAVPLMPSGVFHMPVTTGVVPLQV